MTRTITAALLLGTLLLIFSVQHLEAQKLFTIPGTNGATNTVVLDKDDNIYFDDGSARIKKLDAVTGTVTTIAGTGTSGHSGSNGPAISANIDASCAIAVHPNGDLYIAEQTKNWLRKVDHVTGTITDVAGTGVNLNNGDGLPASVADIGAPESICIDAAGNIFIGNVDCIRKIDGSTNIISTVAGTHYTAGYAGDGGPATSALLEHCAGLVVDAIGNIYFSDQGNSVVRKVNTAGTISTIAGNGSSGFSGDGGAATSAQLFSPDGLALDARGNLYITVFNRVRKVTSGGIISTIAGTGTVFPGNGDCLHPMSMNMGVPAVATDSHDDLYFGDFVRGRVLKTSWYFEIDNIELNTICKPGFSTPAVAPAFITSVKGGVPPYTFTWAATTGNTATLNATNISNPEVISMTGNNLAYTLTVTQGSTCHPSASLPVKATFNTNQTFDLALRDSHFDMYDEPNSQESVEPNHWDFWAAPDLWNRLAQDGKLTHQDPCAGSCNNYMYATIRNVGCTAYTNSVGADLKLYWTLGGFPETWPGAWTTDPFPPNTSLPLGLQVATIPMIGTLNPGQKVQKNTSWTPPVPSTYFPGNQEMAVCFLARVVDGHNTSVTDGMSFAEVPGISTNVRNNNNIITRNTRAVELSFYSPKLSWLTVGNSERNPRNYTLQFINAQPAMSSLNQFMTVTVHLGPVFQIWQNAGGKGTYASIDPIKQTVTFDGTTPMQLDNIPFAAHEQYHVMLSFEMKPGSKGWEMNDELIQFRQLYNNGGTTEVYGNYDYYVSYSGEGDAGERGGGAAGRKENTGVNTANMESSIIAFPNPAHTTLYLQFPIVKEGTVRIMDMAGKTIATQQLYDARTVYFNVADYTPGMYMYELFDGVRSYTGKVAIGK